VASDDRQALFPTGPVTTEATGCPMPRHHVIFTGSAVVKGVCLAKDVIGHQYADLDLLVCVLHSFEDKSRHGDEAAFK
jgi:hypothetical protein